MATPSEVLRAAQLVATTAKGPSLYLELAQPDPERAYTPAGMADARDAYFHLDAVDDTTALWYLDSELVNHAQVVQPRQYGSDDADARGSIHANYCIPKGIARAALLSHLNVCKAYPLVQSDPHYTLMLHLSGKHVNAARSMASLRRSVYVVAAGFVWLVRTHARPSDEALAAFNQCLHRLSPDPTLARKLWAWSLTDEMYLTALAGCIQHIIMHTESCGTGTPKQVELLQINEKDLRIKLNYLKEQYKRNVMGQ
jgi:hypothetical protein